MSLPGGTLLLVADQGFGDMIQFARYIPMIRAACRNLIVGWGPEVTALLGQHPDIATCFASWAAAPPHDAYVLLSSLPQIFGTELSTIPASMPYLSVDPARVAHWGERLAALRPQRRLRVGLAWSGRPTHPNNRAVRFGWRRWRRFWRGRRRFLRVAEAVSGGGPGVCRDAAAFHRFRVSWTILPRRAR